MGVKFNPFTGNLDLIDTTAAAGADTQVQFNNGGNLAGSADLTWDDTGKELGIGGDINLDDGGTYATTLQLITPTANRTISFPDATGTVGLVGGSSGQLVYNNAGAYAGAPSTSVGATGNITLSLAGAASTPPVSLTGTWFSGGTSTTTKPQLLIEPVGTTSTAWSTSGTGLGVNAASAFTGRLFDFQVNGSSKAVLTGAGLLGVGTTTVNRQFVLHDNGLACLALQNSTTGNGASDGFQIQLSSSDAYVWNYESGPIILGTANNERARIDSSGRLLVGTDSALSDHFGGSGVNLQLAGTTYQASAAQLNAFASNQYLSPHLVFNKERGTQASPSDVLQNDKLGGIVFTGYAASTANQIAARIECYVDGEPGTAGDTSDLPGRLVFGVSAEGSALPYEAMRINNAGELLIGYTSDNGAYKLQVNSQIFATSATIATSDGRYKENVATLDGCMDLVKALRPVSFDWKHQEPITRIDEEGETVVVREAHNFPDGTQVGFIAQEVETVLADKPWLSSVIKQNVRPAVTDNEGNELAPEEEFLGIAEGNLVAVLTSALKDAIGEIESLKARVAALESA